jgi:hypothetical protein
MWKFKAQFLAQGLLACLVLITVTGCECVQDYSLTYKVWNSSDLRHYREAASNPNVQVFEDTQQKDFLVTYDEVRDTTDQPRRRAYFLGANERRLSKGQKPSFTNPKRAAKLPSIPVNGDTNQVPFTLYGTALTIQTEKGKVGPYPLPAYEDRSGLAQRLALSPLAVAGDAVLGGLLAGLFAAMAYAYGGGSGSL